MSDEDTGIVCPECERRFYVVWWNDGLGAPEYCPMCGAEMDYAEAARKDAKP